MFIQKFEDVASSPEEWFDKAEELRYSAEVLFDFEKNRTRFKRECRKGIMIGTNISVMSQVIMLYGLALEVLVKSLAVKKGFIKVVNGTLKEVDHNLIKIIEKLDIKLEKEELDYLTKVVRHTIWEGRYPCPTKNKDFTEEYTSKNINSWRFTYVGNNDFEKINSIYIKIISIVESELFT